MYNRRDDRPRPESSADRIRRRVERLEEDRRNFRPKINPFTLISIVIILVLAIVMGNMVGN